MIYFLFQAVFERLVDIICDKMSESLDSDPTLNTNKGTRLDNAQPSNVNCNCWKQFFSFLKSLVSIVFQLLFDNFDCYAPAWVPFVLIFVQPTYCISVCCLWSPNDHRWQPVMELEPMSLLIIYPAYSRCFLAINLNGKLFSIYRLFHKYISSKVSRLISQNSAQIPQPQRYRVHALFDRISKYSV